MLWIVIPLTQLAGPATPPRRAEALVASGGLLTRRSRSTRPPIAVPHRWDRREEHAAWTTGLWNWKVRVNPKETFGACLCKYVTIARKVETWAPEYCISMLSPWLPVLLFFFLPLYFFFVQIIKNIIISGQKKGMTPQTIDSKEGGMKVIQTETCLVQLLRDGISFSDEESGNL